MKCPRAPGSSPVTGGMRNLSGPSVRGIDSGIYLVHQIDTEFMFKGGLPGQGKWQYSPCPMDRDLILADL